MSTFTPGGPPRFAHQRAGLRDIIRNRGVHALLFDPGTGKTATTLDYASLLALKSPSGVARVLVVAPLAAVDTWVLQSETFVASDVAVHAEVLGGSVRQRAERMARIGGNPFPRSSLRTSSKSRGPQYLRQGPPGAPGLILLAVNFDAFASKARSKGSGRTAQEWMLEAVKRFRPDLLVVDESHRIKSAFSNTSKALAKIGATVPRRIILTGTVMPHSPLDVFGQWRFLDPLAFGSPLPGGATRPTTFAQFRGTYARMGGWMGKEILGFRNLDHMQQVMAQRSTVARKEDVLDLPPVTDVYVPVDLSPAEVKAYREMKDNLAAQLASGALASVPNRLAQMMRLRQITSGFLPDDTGAVTTLGESKARTIRSLAHDTLTGEKRLVVFAHFRHEIDLLARLLAEKGTEVLVVTGATPSEERARYRRRFASTESTRLILLAQIKTMSLAVNELVAASHAIFASLPSQRDDIEQARARLDRQGQTRPVTIWTVAAPKTVDDVILKAYRDRTDLETAMLKHISG